MVNVPTKTVDSNSKLEDKQSELSHKVWNLEKPNPKIDLNNEGKLNSDSIQQTKKNMRENIIYASNYGQNADERRVLIKISDEIYYYDFKKINT